MKAKRSRATTTLRHRKAALLMGLLLVILATLSARSKGSGDGAGPRGGSYDLTWYTIDGGGAMFTSGGDFELSGTIGQPDAGVLTGGGFQLTGGFWFEQPPGDCNSTGSVNLFDYDAFEACLSGPDGGVAEGCACFDMDASGDVDLVDFALFQDSFTG